MCVMLQQRVIIFIPDFVGDRDSLLRFCAL